MGNRTVLALMLLLACVNPLVFSQTPPRDTQSEHDQATGVIRGRVVAAGTGESLGRVPVVAFPVELLDPSARQRGPVTRGATSSDSGDFEIRNLPPGRYVLSAQLSRERPQYLPTTYGARGRSSRGAPIDVAPGGVVEKIVIAVERAGVINGRVVNEFGEPVAFVRVNALLIRPIGGEPSMIGFGRETDDLGRFRIFGLQPGEYVLKAESEVHGPSSDFEGTRPLSYVPVFYPSALAQEEAQRIAIEPGQEIADLEIGLRRGRTYKVSGAVVTSQRAGTFQGVGISYSRDASSWNGVSTSRDGTFTISGLLPGEYTFVASVNERGDPDIEPEASRPIKVQVEQDVEGLVLQTRRGARVSGRVVIESGSFPSAALQITLIRPDPSAPYMWGPTSNSATVRADGTFTLARVFGDVLFRIIGADASTVKSVTYKGADVTDVPTEFPDVAEPRDLTITLAARGAEIVGTVADEKGLPARDAAIFLFAVDEKRWATWAQTTRQTVLRSGKFSIARLRAGRYFIAALDPEEQISLYGPPGRRLFERLAKLATPIEVIENDRREIALTLTRLPKE